MCELRERQQGQERELWKERLEAELREAEKKVVMEKTAVSSTTKLLKLNITPFKGTAGGWVRFENMFPTQVDAKAISDEEKYCYLLESVGRKVRDRIANLKRGTVGCKTAWDRLKKEYGQTKVVVNAHMDEIINLFPVKGSNYFRVQEFYEKLSRNYDSLPTLEEGQRLQGFMMTTLNKLPHVKPDHPKSSDIKVTHIKDEHVYSEIGTCQQPCGSKHGKELAQCSPMLATYGEAYPSHPQSGHAPWCCKHNGNH